MKKIKFLFSLLFVAVLAGCSEDDSDTGFIDNAAEPQNISATFNITQDNTGLVTIIPTGEGVTEYEVYFGDGTTEPEPVSIGGRAIHTYAEGQYDVRIIGKSLNGKTAEAILPLTVSFIAPENLEVVITNVTGNPFKINVTAEADYEAYFEVTYGDDAEAQPEQFLEGEIASHTYAETGTYTVTVIAYSGGVETTVYTEEVTITNPLVLPIDFENETLNYTITDFNGCVSAVIDNPDPSGINTSATVAAMTPAEGAVWTGGFLTLDTPVDLTAEQHDIRIKVWSPAAGITVKLKLENLTDAGIAHEVDAVTTVANQWEELIYDFSGASTTDEYSKVVVFFNAGNPGTGDTYYFDDIELYDGTEAVELPLTFENPTVEYTWNNFGGAIGSRIENPDMSGINTSGNVGQFLKTAGSETWGGIAIPMDEPIDFSTMQKVKMKVWSPAAGIPVLMKFENMNPHDDSVDVEITTTTTVANQWEEITFDFTGINNDNDYQQIVIFFNFGASGTGETYYFDDVQLSN